MRILFIFLVLVSCSKPVSNGKIYSYMGKICIEGHVYHQFNAYTASTYAIKLDDNGKPIKCEGNQYWERSVDK